MKNVIAYSLWGEHPMFWFGACRNIEQAKEFFPGWICRFYIDRNCPQNLIDSLIGENVEIVLMDSKASFEGAFWRFEAAADPSVDIMLSRDCDSRFSHREVSAINEWLVSDKEFHIMRDHPYHTVPILAGMWGCRNGLLRRGSVDIVSMINNWTHYTIKGCDQDFLGQVIYPLVKDVSMEHSEFNLRYGNDVLKFPIKRVNYEFVGDIFDENDVRHPDHWKIIKHIEG